ncbi:MAG: proline-rich domain-containing protein [Candidatus Woesearchaeota archaeon]
MDQNNQQGAPQGSQGMPSQGQPTQGMPQPPQGAPQGPQGMPQPPSQPPQGYSQGQSYINERTHIEEIAEAIIDEKWDELVKNLNKISEWKDKTEEKINKFEQELQDVRESFDKLHKAIIGKIGEYDQNILNVGTEIKAMERVFQKILPTFTENVNELSRITKDARNSMSPKKKK